MLLPPTAPALVTAACKEIPCCEAGVSDSVVDILTGPGIEVASFLLTHFDANRPLSYDTEQDSVVSATQPQNGRYHPGCPPQIAKEFGTQDLKIATAWESVPWWEML